MQLVLSNNRIIAHGENFLAMGGVVINTATGAKYENATIAECEGCPSDIDKVGYEYHAGVFVPCAPFGTGDNNGCFMEVCTNCATPRSSGIPIKYGLGRENLSIFPLLWENASLNSNFAAQTISLSRAEYSAFVIVALDNRAPIIGDPVQYSTMLGAHIGATANMQFVGSNSRKITIVESGIEFANCTTSNASVVPLKIYGVKL